VRELCPNTSHAGSEVKFLPNSKEEKRYYEIRKRGITLGQTTQASRKKNSGRIFLAMLKIPALQSMKRSVFWKGGRIKGKGGGGTANTGECA